MAIVTDIKQQKRHTERYSIYVDGQYAFSLSELDLVTSGLRRGMELDAIRLEELRGRSEEGRAYEVAVRYLGYRSRSVQEMRDYLRRKEHADEVVDAIVERLKGYHYLDDHAFAEQWVKDRQALRPRSRRMLEAELMRKGVSTEIIRGAMEGIGQDGQDGMLEILITKKRRQARYQDNGILMAYLARQGFEYDQIKKALARLDD